MQKQTAPGTNTMHIKNGWNFSRLPDGGVKIHKTDLGRHHPPCDPRDYEQHRKRDGDNAPLVEILVSDSEWQSIIAGMSAYEDSAEAFQWAELFHGGKIAFNNGG